MPSLRRALGVWDTTAVVVGTVIGVGIFFTPSQVARAGGSTGGSLALWALGGLVAALGAVTLASFARRYPHTGAHYALLRDAWGPLVGFLFVGCQLTAIQPGAMAIIAHVCATNVFRAVGGAAPDPSAVTLGAVLLVAGVGAANVLGVRVGARLQNVTVVAKLLALAAVIAAALLVEPALPASTATPLPTTFLAGLLPAMFAYAGWQQASWIAGEVQGAERSVPRALLVGVAIVVGVYLAAVWAWFDLLGWAGVASSTALAYDAGRVVAGDGGGRLAAGAVALSAFGVLNALALTAPRLGYALARDGGLPPVFGTPHARFGTPWAAIGLLGAAAITLLLAVGREGIGPLLAWQVVVNAVFFALTGLGVVRTLRAERRWEVAGVAALGFAAFETAAVVAALVDPAVRGAAGSGLLWVGAVAVVYLVAVRGREVRGATEESETPREP